VAAARRSPLLVAFGAAIRRLRTERGWSQEEFAARVGIHRTYIGDLERGARNLGLVNVGRIATALEISLADLMAQVEPSRHAPGSRPTVHAPSAIRSGQRRAAKRRE
jgi:transcriptional regulator with XRE-family HTH domain